MTVNTSLDPLDWPLASTHSLALSVRRDIINEIFNLSLTEQDFRCRDAGLSAFFDDWFEEQCEAAASQLSVRTHRELLQVVAHIQSTDNREHRSMIAEKLRTSSSTAKTPPELAPINASLTLAVRIWLSTSIDSLQHFVTPGHSVLWNSGRSLGDAIDDAFSPKGQSTEMVQLPKAFTAANLEKISGIQVQWTSNLADHLSMKDDDTKVMLFYQASFLELHRESMCTKLPQDLIDETLRTLGLLIPSSDTRSRKWFRKKQEELHLDSKAGSYGSFNATARQIDNFRYWRDRLVVLKQAFDVSEPHKLSLWWHDDRKKVQWYTFWIAALVLILTIVFGLIQSAAAVVQAWASVKALGKS